MIYPRLSDATVFFQRVAIVSRSRYVHPGSFDLEELFTQYLSLYRMSSTQKSTLQTLLKSSAPSKIRASLLDALKTASDTELEVLAVLLAPLSTQASAEKHCLRCHLTYTENKNHSGACKIKHNDEGETSFEIGEDTGITTLSCCGISFDSEDTPDTEICFSTRHTTDEEDVLYYGTDNEDEDDINTNVVKCKVKGCFKKRKATKKAGNKGGSASKKQKST